MQLPEIERIRKDRKKVRQLLATQRAARFSGAPRPLYTLADLNDHLAESGESAEPVRGVPVIGGCWNADWVLTSDVAEFGAALSELCPVLAGFDLKAAGLCLAGGAAGAVLTRAELGRADFDLFMVGVADPVACLASLGDYLDAESDSLAVRRSAATVTFLASAGGDTYAIQVILCVYADVAEVLYSFDLGSSAVAWDGEEVWLSALGLFAYTRRANIVCLEARNASYPHRLEKYYDRGFSIVAPDLGVGDISQDESRVELYELSLASHDTLRSEAESERLDVTYLRATRGHPSQYEPEKNDGQDKIIGINVRAIARGAPECCVCESPYISGCFREDGLVQLDPESVMRYLEKPRELASTVRLWRSLVLPEDYGLLAASPAEMAAALHRSLGTSEFRIPLVVKRASDMSDCWGVFPREPIEPRIWYGKYYGGF